MKNTKTILSTLLAMGVVATTTMSVMALSYDESTITVGGDTETTAATVAVEEKEEETIKEIELSLNKKKISGTEGKKLSIKAKTNSDEKVTFRTTNKEIATVNSKGVVKLKAEGSAKIVAEVGDKKAVCKVKVNKKPGNSITDDTMAQIASEIGCQVDYAYDESTIMCSAYSFAYAYYQVTGTPITPGSVWSYGGCVWTGGNYLHYYSEEDMLSAIKAQIDDNKACVGLLATDSAYTHYVTFYGYTGDGDTLSDFEILDPWDAELTTGAGYSYSYDGYDVVTIG